MYFIKYQPLKERLRTRSVSDREALPYLIVFAGFTELIGFLPMFVEYNFWDGILAGLSVLAAIGGVLYAYQQNGGAAGYDFIHKYVIIGWVVSIRFFFAFIPVAIFLCVIGVRTGFVSCDETGPYDTVMLLLGEVIFYQRIGRHIRDTRNKISEQPSEPYDGFARGSTTVV